MAFHARGSRSGFSEPAATRMTVARRFSRLRRAADTPQNLLDIPPLFPHPAAMPEEKMTAEEQIAYHKALQKIEWCHRSKRTRLYLDGLRLSHLPPMIGKLGALKVLSLRGNQLASLPPELDRLIILTKLDLQDNRFESLPPVIGKLTTLQELSLRKNQLRSLPAEIGQLRSLSELYLWANQLTSLPPEIGQLRKLKKLSLIQNQLTSLPLEIGQLRKLTELYLHENPALGLPPTVLGPTFTQVNKGEAKPASPRAILDYYFSRQLGERPLNEMKLLLVGRGEAGKTSISRALRGEAFQKNQQETAGIEIRYWDMDCPAGDQVKVHLWDFAGQEITHETHRYFLTERSLYLVVLDGRGGQQMEDAEYWLSHVRRYGSRTAEDGRVEDSPVIVVLNKWESPGSYEVEKRRLQREFPNICAFVETDCATGHGIDHLRETLCAVVEQMPWVRAPWPLKYFFMRERLADLVAPDDPKQRRPFLDWPAFQEQCRACGVDETEQQTALAENFNALGIALYYGADKRLRDMHVLDPNWAANGLYGIVRGVQRRPFQDKPGHLWAGEFAAVLEEGMKQMNPERKAMIEEYPEEREGVRVHEFLLELMVDRELGFQAGEHEGRPCYLLPGLLTLDEPEPAEYDVAAHLERAEVRFRYLYEVLPAGVMSRFIVRTHALSEGLHRWQRGVVLGWGGARALLLAERRRNPRVDVHIRGGTAAERQELAGVVRSNMEAIHLGLPEGLRGKEELDLTPPGEQYESVEKLRKLEAEGQPVQVVTRRGVVELPVTPELEQTQPASARQEDAPKLKVFVSYAHKDYKMWDRFKPHLDVMKNEGLVDWWYDGKIRPGSLWDQTIRDEIKEADIVILLMSTPFFASDYIRGVELRQARARHQTGQAEVLPVLLEPTAGFENHPWLSKLQAAPSRQGALRPISSFNRHADGWHEVDKALRAVIAGAAKRRRPRPGEWRVAKSEVEEQN